MWRQLKRIPLILWRVMRGENVAAIRLSPHVWDAQYRKGKWAYLLHHTPNVPIIVWCIEQFMRTHDLAHVTLLDVGCGNGALPIALQRAGLVHTYTGTDVSEAALAEAARACPQCTFLHVPMENPVATTPVDALIFNEVLYYGDAVRTLRAHRALVKPDGVVIVSMYRTLRTRFIWWQLRRVLACSNRFSVTSEERHVRWDVCMCRYK